MQTPIDTLQRIVDLAYQGRSSRQPRAFLRAITEIAEDELDYAAMSAMEGNAEIVNARGEVIWRLPRTA